MIFIKEYAILCINKGGKPYYLQPYYSLEDAKTSLYNIIDLEIKRNRVYYVDNDFFENVFPANIQNSKYLCIKEREVTEWEKTITIQTKKNNIIYFKKSY